MFSIEVDFLARQERYKDLQREAVHEELIHEAEARQPGNWESSRKVAAWIGTHMVKWGAEGKRWDNLSAS